jgi:hypothetical protein
MFKTHYDHFEYVMMPFDLINTLVVFQHLINDVFHEYVVCCINNIFIFSKNMEDHEHHVCLVFEKFLEG